MNKFNRRSLIRKAGLLTIASVAVAGAASETARADALQSQDSVSYQSTPSDGQHCSICKNYIAPAAGAATGTCKVVAGSVSPNGYCLAFEST